MWEIYLTSSLASGIGCISGSALMVCGNWGFNNEPLLNVYEQIAWKVTCYSLTVLGLTILTLGCYFTIFAHSFVIYNLLKDSINEIVLRIISIAAGFAVVGLPIFLSEKIVYQWSGRNIKEISHHIVF